MQAELAGALRRRGQCKDSAEDSAAAAVSQVGYSTPWCAPAARRRCAPVSVPPAPLPRIPDPGPGWTCALLALLWRSASRSRNGPLRGFAAAAARPLLPSVARIAVLASHAGRTDGQELMIWSKTLLCDAMTPKASSKFRLASMEQRKI